MYTELLQKLGLSENEAKMYELLLIKGESKAVDLVPESGLGRGNVYNVLTTLVSKGLVTVTAGTKQIYRAAEPTKLASLVESRRREADRLDAEFREELPKLNSTFNLTTGRPAIQVFEGYEGAQEVTMDSLGAPDGILTYLDLSAITGKFAEMNKQYVKKRIAAKIPKCILVADTPEAHAFFANQNTPLTYVAYLKNYPSNFQTAMEIYGNKITYLTLSEEKQISVMIEDARIAKMHRAQFGYMWKMAGGDPTQLFSMVSSTLLEVQKPAFGDSGFSDQQNIG